MCKEDWAERFSCVPFQKVDSVFDAKDWESKWTVEATHDLGEDEGKPRIDSDTVLVRLAGFGSGIQFEEGAIQKIVKEIKAVVGDKVDFIVVDGDYLKAASFTAIAAELLGEFLRSTLLLVRSCHLTHFKFLYPLKGKDGEQVEEEGWDKFGDRVVVMHGYPPPEDEPSGILNAFAADLNVYVGGGNETMKELARLVPGKDFSSA